MPENINTAAPPVKPDVFHTKSLVAHAAEIRRLGKRLTTDVIEIGRHLTEVRAELQETVGHGHFHAWVDREFEWSDRTTLNFMRVYELSLKSETVSDLNLPMRELYLLAAPSTPEAARTEIIQRAEAGEPVSGASKIFVWRCAWCGSRHGKVSDVEIKKLKAFTAKAGWCAHPLVLHENGSVHVVYNGGVYVVD